MMKLLRSVLLNPHKVIIITAITSASLLLAVFILQYLVGIEPCSLCITQRWPHALVLMLSLCALLPIMAKFRRPILALIGLAFATTASIGAYHLSIEFGWVAGPATCSGNITGETVEELRRQLMAQPFAKCNDIAWSLFGVSLAGYNFMISTFLTIVCGTSVILNFERAKK